MKFKKIFFFVTIVSILLILPFCSWIVESQFAKNSAKLFHFAVLEEDSNQDPGFALFFDDDDSNDNLDGKNHLQTKHVAHTFISPPNKDFSKNSLFSFSQILFRADTRPYLLIGVIRI